MKKGIIIFGVLAAFMLISALPGQAQQYWRQGMWPDTGMNLTSEQIAKIRELTMEFQKDILPMETQLQTLYMELESLSYGNTGQTKFNEVTDKIDALEIVLEKKYMAHENQIRALLTEEQKAFFDRWGGSGPGLGRMSGLGLGMGLDMGIDRGYAGYGRGLGRGFVRGIGRGYAGYGRGYAGFGRGLARFGRGYAQGWGRGFGRGWGRGLGMGRGYWCPWYRQGLFNRFRNWW